MLFGLVWFLAALFQVSVLSRVGGRGWVSEIKNTAKLSLALQYQFLAKKFQGPETTLMGRFLGPCKVNLQNGSASGC